MKKILVVFLLVLSTLPTFVMSQDINPKVRLKFNTRFDFEAISPTNKDSAASSGIHGKFFNIMLDGEINDKFSYSYRQRFSINAVDNFQIAGKDNKSNFHPIDWAYLNYKINDAFTLSAGQQVVMIGGWEYDYAPIDQYFWSDFWNNVYCYELGAMINFTSKDGNHNLGFQISNSPFSTKTFSSLYAYNLIWYGNMDWFKTIYSVNMIEYQKGHFINYIALGNKFTFGAFSLDLDLMNRASAEQRNFFADYSIIGDAKYSFCGKFNAFVKAGYDENSAQNKRDAFVYDRYVLPGTKYFFLGAGLEYYPIKDKKDVRVHAYWTSNNAKPRNNIFNLGLTWNMKVLER
ncbi:MAG: porin [Bacteroidales bacterium]